MTPFIVAEISKTWINGEPADPSTPLLCQSFELAIEVNRLRGYRLHSFQLHALMIDRADDNHDDQLVETIIAVFEAVTLPQPAPAVREELEKPIVPLRENTASSSSSSEDPA